MNQRYPRLFASLLTLVFFCFIWLYVREFPVFSNTLGVQRLAIGAMLAGAIVSSSLLWRYRARFTPLERHRPSVLLILLTTILFSPLFGSWLNRGLGSIVFESFEFVSEAPFVASGYGFLKAEKLKPTGYLLFVKENGVLRKFKYKSQPYYPLTKPGETIMLPIRKGLFGTRELLLK